MTVVMVEMGVADGEHVGGSLPRLRAADDGRRRESFYSSALSPEP